MGNTQNLQKQTMKQIILETKQQTKEILNKFNYFACREYIMMETKHMVELILMKRCVMKEGESYSEFVRRTGRDTKLVSNDGLDG